MPIEMKSALLCLTFCFVCASAQAAEKATSLHHSKQGRLSEIIAFEIMALARHNISFIRPKLSNHKMSMFNRKSEPGVPVNQPSSPPAVSEQANRTSTPARSGGLLSRDVSIKGSVKFLNELLIDGEVEGTINSPGKLSIGEHAQISGEIRAKSVKVRGTVEGNIFATERCELQAGSTLRGDIEAPRLVVDENATFLGSAKVATAE